MGQKTWIKENGEPPWWVGWLMEEYYWLEKGKLPFGDREEHDWQYLLALRTIDNTLAKLREAAMEKARKEAQRERRKPPTAPSRRRRPTDMHLSGPTVVPE